MKLVKEVSLVIKILNEYKPDVAGWCLLLFYTITISLKFIKNILKSLMTY